MNRPEGQIGTIAHLRRRDRGRTIKIKGSAVGRLLLIDVASSVAVLGLWYLVFSTYNRK